MGCGDFRCGKTIYDDLNIQYTGYDIYKELISHNQIQFPKYEFIHLDFLENKETLLNADLCILKDVLQHWSLDNI